MYLYSKAYDIPVVETFSHLLVLSSDPTKCAENVQKLVNNRRSHGTKLELIEALSLYLPSSAVYPTLSMLPAPNLTKPTDSITLASQSAIYNPLPVIEEIIKLTKAEEDMTYRTEVDKRRMRLGAPPLEILKADVGREIWTNSKASSPGGSTCFKCSANVDYVAHTYRSHPSTQKFSITLRQLTN